MSELNDFQEQQLRNSWEFIIDSYCTSRGLGQIDKAAIMVLAELDIDHSLEQALNARTRLDNTRNAWNGENLFGCDLAFKMMSDDRRYRNQMKREYIKLKKEAGHPVQDFY